MHCVVAAWSIYSVAYLALHFIFPIVSVHVLLQIWCSFCRIFSTHIVVRRSHYIRYIAKATSCGILCAWSSHRCGLPLLIDCILISSSPPSIETAIASCDSRYLSHVLSLRKPHLRGSRFRSASYTQSKDRRIRERRVTLVLIPANARPALLARTPQVRGKYPLGLA
jgi:hypothetical protein